MATIDLTTPPVVAEGTLEGLPRRVALTRPELDFLASAAGGAPLPFVAAETSSESASTFESRLGQSPGAAEDQSYANALTTLHDPVDSLTRRGLLTDGVADPGVIGALGLLATPAVAVDLDVSIDGTRARAWHRQRGEAVATLATTDGLVFELAWFQSAHWPAELGRVAILPEDHGLEESALPDLIDLPYELLDAGAEAVRTGRGDLLITVVAHHSGTCIDGAGEQVPDATVASVVSALTSETRGRMRALVADIDAGADKRTGVVGVVSWVLLLDGWHVVRSHQSGGTNRVEIRRTNATELAADLGPTLAQVTS